MIKFMIIWEYIKITEDIMKFKGFTLAEVLVTLGIIGVVSAMTIPSLTQSWQKQAYVTQLKKVYSEVTQATNLAITENHAMTLGETEYGAENAQSARDFMNKYFKVVQDCGKNFTPCFADSYKDRSGHVDSFRSWQTNLGNCVTIASGAAICLDYGDGDWPCSDNDNWCKQQTNGAGFYPGYYDIYIDINGKKGPNVRGRDYFRGSLLFDGRLGEGLSTFTRDRDGAAAADEVCAEQMYEGGCLERLLHNGWVMDY